MFNVSFNAGKTREAIREAIRKLDDPTPMFKQIGDYMVDATRQRFIQGVDPQGRPWAPKSSTTLQRYERLGYGRLTKPLKGPGGRLSSEIVKFVSNGGVVFGSNEIYSGVMQDGAAQGAFGRTRRNSPIPWGRIPARQWLGISQQDETAILVIVDAHLQGLLNAGK